MRNLRITSRHAFKRWLLYYLKLPAGATYKEIHAALLSKLESCRCAHKDDAAA